MLGTIYRKTVRDNVIRITRVGDHAGSYFNGESSVRISSYEEGHSSFATKPRDY